MRQAVTTTNKKDKDGNPTGGGVRGVGILIDWQDGELGRGAERQEPNGAYVETVIQIALERLEFYQTTKFVCRENQDAIGALYEALGHLETREGRREQRGVDGTHEV